MKMKLGEHVGEISEHNSFDWMARCLRDAAFLGEAEPTADRLRDVILVMLERLALIEGTKGAQWDEFLSTTTPRPPKDLMANGRAFVAEALKWLELECHHEAAAMDRIAGIRHYATAIEAQNNYLVTLAALAEQDERIRTVLGEAARPESIPNCPCVSGPVVEGADGNVTEALEWLERDCNRDGATMERINILRNRMVGLATQNAELHSAVVTMSKR